MLLWIGTSGFQYPEWKGKFYPEKIFATQMLPYYAERFESTEVNYSFRRIPSRKTIDAWDAATPRRFKLSFKAPQRVTHFAKLRDCAKTLQTFRDAVSPLGKKLGAVLFQLPPTFKIDTPLLNSFLDDLPRGMRAAFEFRHESWFNDNVFACLRKHKSALCIAETEQLTTPVVSTARFGYLRLRREDYRRSELAQWAEFVRAQTRWREAFVYFKHEESGVGPKFARLFKKLTSD
jgi:uncharacterized protein YecE (DUF72 family)